MKVVVSLSRTDVMPMSPKDSIAGRWQLDSVLKDGEDITKTIDPEHKESLFIMWTMNYRKTHADGSQSSGYWHMDAHQPEFHMIDFNREVDIEVYIVSFKEDTVVMRKKEDDGTRLVYKRE